MKHLNTEDTNWFATKTNKEKAVGLNEANPILVDRFPISKYKQIFMLLARHHSICSDQLIGISPKFMT